MSDQSQPVRLEELRLAPPPGPRMAVVGAAAESVCTWSKTCGAVHHRTNDTDKRGRTTAFVIDDELVYWQ